MADEARCTVNVTIHPWCRNIQRDEAVRAAEDGRQGPLPTLEECISRAGQFAASEAPQGSKCTERDSVTNRRPVEPGGGENVTPDFAEQAKRSAAVSETGDGQSGLRTERVVLEITHDLDAPLGEWIVQVLDESLGYDEYVRVVKLTHFDDLANMALERDAAIRERDTLKARVDELESAAKLAPPANTDAPSNHAAPAASGWLTAEERRLIEGMMESASAFPPTMHWHSGLSVRDTLRIMQSLLSRSSPPEVVLPGKPLAFRYGDDAIANRDGQWREALAAAGVTCKEVGRE